MRISNRNNEENSLASIFTCSFHMCYEKCSGIVFDHFILTIPLLPPFGNRYCYQILKALILSILLNIISSIMTKCNNDIC